MRIRVCYNTYIGGLSMISTSNKNFNNNLVLIPEYSNQGNSCSKPNVRPMTPAEILWYNDLTRNCYQMSIYEFIENPTQKGNK